MWSPGLIYLKASGIWLKEKIFIGEIGLMWPATSRDRMVCSVLSTSGGLSQMLGFTMSIPWYEQLRSNGSMGSELRLTMSFFPISRSMPLSASSLHDSSSRSPVRELSTTSTPRPLVSLRMPGAKSVLREENMRSAGMPYWSVNSLLFSWVPTVAKISAPRCWQSWMLASPTPPAAECMRTDWFFSTRARSIRP